MGDMTALEYLGRPAADRPVEPSGLVLIATAAGRLAERGLAASIAGAVHTHLPFAGHMLPQEASHAVSAAIDLAMAGTPCAEDGLAVA